MPAQPVTTNAVTDHAHLDLDGRNFDMVSSTGSRVDPDAPTRFTYHEHAGVLWGEYVGDTVELGRFAGERIGDRIEIAFVHRTVTGVTQRGQATSLITVDPSGALVLTEDFTSPDGAPQVSVCREVCAGR